MKEGLTRNSVIDRLLGESKTTEEILQEVLKAFPSAPESAVKRQIYSRRNAIKNKVTA